MHMHMVFAHHSFQDAHVFGVADLHDEVAASDFDLALQDVLAVLRHPDDVRRESGDAMAVMAILLHSPSSTTRRDG